MEGSIATSDGVSIDAWCVEGSFNSLEDFANRGYIIDEWKRWQQGGCLEYAHALLLTFPHLKAGELDDGMHFFAHDDEFAYDSAGKHPLPYCGIDGDMKPALNIDLSEWDEPDPAEVHAAKAHIRRHCPWPGRRFGPLEETRAKLSQISDPQDSS